MKVLINAFDSATARGPFPNLAAMKIARYHKLRGDEVALVGKGLIKQDSMADPDIVYCCVIFTWNASRARGSRWLYPNAEFLIGGSGVDLETMLPPEIDLSLPDYDIYNDRGVPGWPFALGFSTRGCNRTCSFCIVPKKEGRITTNGAIGLQRIIDESPVDDKLLLLDNNFIQSPTVEKDLQWLAEWGGKVNYSQGIDARVLKRYPHLAAMFQATNYQSRVFGGKMLTLAYDWPKMSHVVTKVCQILRDAGFNLRQHVQWYVLVNYHSTFEQDLERVNHLRREKTNPYVMIFEKKDAPKRIKKFARWANSWPIFHSTEWQDYDVNIRNKPAKAV